MNKFVWLVVALKKRYWYATESQAVDSIVKHTFHKIPCEVYKHLRIDN